MTSINESYYSVGASKVFSDRGTTENHIVHEPEPKEEIERCLNCSYRDCTDICPYSPYYRKPKPPKPKMTTKERYLSKLDEVAKKRADNVSKLFMDGWCESGIAWELGLTRSEVVESLKVAKKAGFLD